MALIDLNQVKTSPEVDYMTKGEMTLFKELRKTGQITFFKCGNCRVCDVEIIKDKLYCSKQCKEKKENQMSQGKSGNIWFWSIDLKLIFGKRVKIETKDGMFVEGVLSGEEKDIFEFDGVIVGNLKSFELDNDREKIVDACRIKKVEILD